MLFSVKQVVGRKFPPCDEESNDVKRLNALRCALAFDCRSGIIDVKWSEKKISTDSTMQGAVALQQGRKVVKKSFNITLLDGRHRCSAVRQIKAVHGRRWTKYLLRVTQVNQRDGN